MWNLLALISLRDCVAKIFEQLRWNLNKVEAKENNKEAGVIRPAAARLSSSLEHQKTKGQDHDNATETSYAGASMCNT